MNELLTNSLFAFKVLTGTETQDLNAIIKSGKSLAVKARLLKGNYQITANTLQLAIDTNDPDIVDDIINAGANVTSQDVAYACSLRLSDIHLITRNQSIMITSLANAMKAKGNKLEPSDLMPFVEKSQTEIVEFLIELNVVEVTEEHLEKATEIFERYQPLLNNPWGNRIIRESRITNIIPEQAPSHVTKLVETLSKQREFHKKDDLLDQAPKQSNEQTQLYKECLNQYKQSLAKLQNKLKQPQPRSAETMRFYNLINDELPEDKKFVPQRVINIPTQPAQNQLTIDAQATLQNIQNYLDEHNQNGSRSPRKS